MAIMNVLSMINKKIPISDVVLFGRVEGLIQKPDFLGSLEVSGGSFAVLRVYAVKFLGEDTAGAMTGFYGDKSVYMVNGSVLIAQEDSSFVGKLCAVGGRRGKGTNIRRQFTNTIKYYEGYQSFVFSKSEGNWVVVPNYTRLLTRKDVVGTNFAEYLNLSSDGVGTFTYPHSVSSMQEFLGFEGCDYIAEKSSENLNNVSAEGGTVAENTQGTPSKEDKKLVFSNPGAIPRLENGRVDVSKIDMKLVYHLEAQERSQLAPAIWDEIEVQNKKASKYAKEVVYSLKGYEVRLVGGARAVANDIYNAYRRVCSLYSSRLLPELKEKGSFFVDKLLNSLEEVSFASDEEVRDRAARKTFLEGLERVKKGIAVNPNIFSREFADFVPILGDEVKMAILVMGNLTGVGETALVENYNYCYKNYETDIKDWFSTLLLNPYKLGMLGVMLPLVACDKIFFSFGSIYIDRYGEEGEKDKLVSEAFEMREYMTTLESIRKESEAESGTLVKMSTLYLKKFEYYPKIDRRYFKENGLPFRMVYIAGLELLFGERMVRLSLNDMVEAKPLSKSVVESLCGMGVLDSINDTYIVFTKDMYREYVIYDTLWKKGNESTDITDDEIDSTIEEFESEKGFKLESLQKKGVKLVKYKAAVLSGCAGSGKTTTSDCMSACLKKYLPEGYTIVYGTPTGKACRRLSEVVHSSVRTLHSLFGVGMSGDSLLSPPKGKWVNFNSKCVYILDEMAMCNIDLMYSVVSSLSDSDLIYFLGDIKQLPPIGRGIPFSMLMTFLPCVELGVSKRAAEGSLVNYNCTMINFLSDSGSEELVSDNDTFVMRSCSDEMIKSETLKMFKDLMNGVYNHGTKYAEDDITVITQYQTDKIPWSAPILNLPLQEFLRANDTLLFQNGDRKFYKNDRVIHMRRNCYNMRRYEFRKEDGFFHELVTMGAVNGEVGKLVGVVKANKITVLPFNEKDYRDERGKSFSERDEELIKRHEERLDALRDDSEISDSDVYFAVVEFYDTELERNALVFYRARLRQVISGYGSDETAMFEGVDLGYLELAYALTAHKMQGSQEKAIIAVFGSAGSPMFVNRNMINVIFTRSQEFVGAIGSVSGKDSAIGKGRKYKSPRVRGDILGILAGEVSV